MIVQLRDYQSKLVTVGTTLPPPVSPTINKTTGMVGAAHRRHAAGYRPIQIGDTVYFRSMNDNGLTYLSRSGDNTCASTSRAPTWRTA
jgi:hypothetical protein